MNKWIELEDGFLTNQPMIRVRRGRKSEMVPDPERPPTIAYLFVRDCVRNARGRVTRKRRLEILEASTPDALDEAICTFSEREDVIHMQAKEMA